MKDLRPIRTERAYEPALAEVKELWGANRVNQRCGQAPDR
jgi:antitoxin component HigA of HigAB toxin-antitoxin module